MMMMMILDGWQNSWRRLGSCAVAAALIIAPLAAAAQDEPLAAGPDDVPSYARPAQSSADETIHGRIRSVDGAFTISVNDDRGFIDTVELHPGTIINPTGLRLSPEMSVTILGYNAGSAFDANEIDTPYSYDGQLPSPVYYGPGYWCPGFAYGYGPSFWLGISFGGGYGAWSFEHRPFYGRPWDGHAYFGGYVGAAVVRGRVAEHREPVAANGRTPSNAGRAPGAEAPRPGIFIDRGVRSEPSASRERSAQEFSRAETSRAAAAPGYSRAQAGGYSGSPRSGEPSGHGGSPGGSAHSSGGSHAGGGGHSH